jgi:hypothetical protein
MYPDRVGGDGHDTTGSLTEIEARQQTLRELDVRGPALSPRA